MLELRLVKAFHRKYKIPIVNTPAEVPIERIRLRQTLLHEEIMELVEAHTIGNIEEKAKETIDVLYVILGTALELGYHKDFDNIKLFNDITPDSDKSNALKTLSQLSDQFNTDWSKENLMKLLTVLCEYLRLIGLKENFQDIMQEVHRSNMSKGTDGKPIIRADGKIMKGKDFTPADLSFLSRCSKII